MIKSLRLLAPSFCLLAVVTGLLGADIQSENEAKGTPPQARSETPPRVGGHEVSEVLRLLGARLEEGATEQQLRSYRRVFGFADLDGDGKHSREEFVERGRYMTVQARRGIFRATDSNRDGIVTREEYVLNRIITDEAKAILQKMDRDGNGAVSKEEFLEGASIPDAELRVAVFVALDTNGDGQLFVPEFLRVWGLWARVASDPLPADDLEEIPLPPLVIDGRPARAHTQGLIVHERGFFITARRDDVSPRRALLLSTHGRDAFKVWDITPELPGAESRDVLDHPGGLDSDGERLWIPVSHSRRDGKTVVRAYSIEALLAGQEATPTSEFHIDDHIGAIAVSKDRGELYGANWDTLKVYVWNLKGELRRSFTREKFVVGVPGWSSAVQDWKIDGDVLMAGDVLIAGGLDKSSDRPQDHPRALVQTIDLSSRKRLGELRLSRRAGIGDLTREGMAMHDGSLWFLPEDLGPRNRVLRIDATPLRRAATEADAASSK